MFLLSLAPLKLPQEILEMSWLRQRISLGERRQCVSTGAALLSARGSLSQSGKLLDLPEMHRQVGQDGCRAARRACPD